MIWRTSDGEWSGYGINLVSFLCIMCFIFISVKQKKLLTLLVEKNCANILLRIHFLSRSIVTFLIFLLFNAEDYNGGDEEGTSGFGTCSEG